MRLRLHTHHVANSGLVPLATCIPLRTPTAFWLLLISPTPEGWNPESKVSALKIELRPPAHAHIGAHASDRLLQRLDQLTTELAAQTSQRYYASDYPHVFMLKLYYSQFKNGKGLETTLLSN